MYSTNNKEDSVVPAKKKQLFVLIARGTRFYSSPQSWDRKGKARRGVRFNKQN